MWPPLHCTLCLSWEMPWHWTPAQWLWTWQQHMAACTKWQVGGFCVEDIFISDGFAAQWLWTWQTWLVVKGGCSWLFRSLKMITLFFLFYFSELTEAEEHYLSSQWLCFWNNHKHRTKMTQKQSSVKLVVEFQLSFIGHSFDLAYYIPLNYYWLPAQIRPPCLMMNFHESIN